MRAPPVLLLGCGYTLGRVARRLREAGREVHATTREAARGEALAADGVVVHRTTLPDAEDLARLVRRLPAGLVLVHGVPPLRGPDGPEDATPAVLAALAGRLRRIVLLSSTGVYGRTAEVDERTPAAPADATGRARRAAEQAVLADPAAALVLRPGAIYGPGRGVHARLRQGRLRLVAGRDDPVSRIHVDDLATHVVAAVDADVEGAWPVADEAPASTRTLVRFCVERLGLPPPDEVAAEAVGATRRTTRRVDGRAVRRALGIALAHPTWREGLLASLAAEARGEEG